MPDAQLFQYYERQDVLPTFSNFRSRLDLANYAKTRARLFNERLLLPVRTFRDADLLEFGPDSGENALVFATWGARLTLVEPNLKALSQIRRYFAQFDLEHRLHELVSTDVVGFCSAHKYDVIDAEGFIYTIKPTQSWLAIFAALLRPGGYGIVSYYERYGGFFELTLKAIYAAVKQLTGKPATEAARAVFQTKWDAIPHTRTFASWVMDVMENPFVRIHYFLDAAQLVTAAHKQGFDTHSAWPVYADPLAIYWHKAVLSNDFEVERSVRHLKRSRLSFASGRKLYLAGEEEAVGRVTALLDRLLVDVDALIDAPLGDRLQPFIDGLAVLSQEVQSAAILCDHADAKKNYSVTLKCLQQMFSFAARRDYNGMLDLAKSDPAFVADWGMPTHFFVMRCREA